MGRIFTGLFLVLALAGRSSAADGMGLGAIIGEPTGLSLRYGNFPVVGLAWSFDDYFHMHCDYWVHTAPLGKEFTWFLGIGGKYLRHRDSADRKDRDTDHSRLGLRVPVGIQFFPLPELELFAEAVPGMLVIPETRLDIDAGIGVRYFFR